MRFDLALKRHPYKDLARIGNLISPAQLNAHIARLKVLLTNLDLKGNIPNTVDLFPKSGCDRTEFKKIIRVFDETFGDANLSARVNNGPNKEFAQQNLGLVQECEKLALYVGLHGMGTNRGKLCSKHSKYNCSSCKKI